jgi:hypothetical protein
LPCCGPILLFFIFALLTRSAWRDRRSNMLPEGGDGSTSQRVVTHFYLAKAGLARDLAFGQQSLRMTLAGRNVRRAGLRPPRWARKDLAFLRPTQLQIRDLRQADTATPMIRKAWFERLGSSQLIRNLARASPERTAQI